MKFDIKSVFLPEIILNDTFSKDMELDSTLPENAPDIIRLIRIDAKMGKPEVTFNGGKAEVNCNVDFGILYESDYKSRLAYVTVPGNFSLKADCPDLTGEYYTNANVGCSYLTCKLLGPRKFVIRAKMNTDLAVTTVKEVKTVDSDASQVNAFFLTQKVNSIGPCGTYTENYTFSDVLPAEGIVDQIVYIQADAGVPEVSVSEGRLNVKSKAVVKVLYATEDGLYDLVTQTYPVNLTFENENITPDQIYRVDIWISDAGATIETDDYGDNKLISVNYTISMLANCFEKIEDTVACDGFCADRSSQSEIVPVSYKSLSKIAEKTFTFDKTHDTEKTDIREILDTGITFNITEKTIKDGVLNIKGNMDIEVLTRTDSGISSVDFGGEFDESINIEEGNTVADITLKAVEVNSNVYGGENISVRALVHVRADVYTSPAVNVLASFTADDNATPADGAIRFYYPEKAETAWSVAKKYRKNPKKLMDDNRNVFETDGTLKDSAAFIAVL